MDLQTEALGLGHDRIDLMPGNESAPLQADQRKALRVRPLAWLGMNQPMTTELSATNATICVPARSAAED